jgi:hypothetical protein
MNNKPFWITIANNGDTVDGRYIPTQHLLEMVETFNTKNFQPTFRASFQHEGKIFPIADIKDIKTVNISGFVSLCIFIEPYDSWYALGKRMQQNMEPDVFPCIEYISNHDRFEGKSLLASVELTHEPAIRDLEPLNKKMVRA